MLSVFDKSYFVSPEKKLFFVESQVGVYCGMHAINNLLQLQKDRLTQKEWDTSSVAFTEESKKVDKDYNAMTVRGATPEFVLHMVESFKKYDTRSVKVTYKPRDGDMGVIVHAYDHFFCVKWYNDKWYMLDSMTYKGTKGYYVGVKDVRIFLNNDRVNWAYMVCTKS